MVHARRKLPAFTLIELLVVIAIIGTLIAILLPALRSARISGWKAVSLANMHSLVTAGTAYQLDQKGHLPIVPTGVPVPDSISGFVTWGGWGKSSGLFWLRGGGIFDIPPSARPLNPYMYDGHLPARAEILAYPQVRRQFTLPALRDPSDKIGHQQTWDAFEPTFGVVTENADRTSCYDDVGTSYLCQMKWFFQTARSVTGSNWTKAWQLGTARLRAADTFDPFRMIWVNDEYTDLVINQVSDEARIRNGYGDINKGIVGYLDGHARYLKLIPGGENDPRALTEPWLVPAFNNPDYSVVFPHISR